MEKVVATERSRRNSEKASIPQQHHINWDHDEMLGIHFLQMHKTSNSEGVH